MAYESYLEELARLAAGGEMTRTSVKISVVRSFAGASGAEIVLDGNRASSLRIAVFSATAARGAKARIVIPVDPSREIDHLAAGTTATAVGTLSVGHAVAIEVDGQIILPSGPADRPVFRVPKL